MSSSQAGWEHLEAGATMGVHAWAPTRAGAFAQADSPERLLAGWINECLYVHEIEGFVVCRVEVDACTGSVVHGILHGEEIDSARHRLRANVKAATLRGVSVVESRGLHDVRVMVDQ